MASDPVFLDSNGWVALLNMRDPLNAKANTLFRELGRIGRPIVLTDWIVAETGNGLARIPARTLVPETVARFLRSSRFTVVFVSPNLMERALSLYAERSDKAWGLVDCASFVVMTEQGITEAFTTDRHFEQAGFRCLLPSGTG
jgi:predicted nucleic acid-binding protein